MGAKLSVPKTEAFETPVPETAEAWRAANVHRILQIARKGGIGMEQGRSQENLCRSVFQNGETAPTKEGVTKAWIAMVNRIEGNRTADTPQRL